MALSSNVVWEIRTAGNQNFGGGYSSGGTDYSQQDSYQVVFTGNLSMAGSGTTLNSSTAVFSSSHVGNLIYITGGANFVVSFYEVTGYNSSTSVEIDRNATNGSAASSGYGYLGGANSNIGRVASNAVAGNKVWIKAGTHSQSSTLTFPNARASYTDWIEYEGYSSTRGDAETPVANIDGGGGSFDLVNIGTSTTSNNYYVFKYLNFTNVVKTAFARAVYLQGENTILYRCRFGSCGSHAFHGQGNYTRVIGCTADDYSRSGVAGVGIRLQGNLSVAIDCYTTNGRGDARGIDLIDRANCINCIATDCRNGFMVDDTDTNDIKLIADCTAYNCVHGFVNYGTGIWAYFRNCLAHTCSSYGFYLAGITQLNGAAVYNCTSNVYTGSSWSDVHYIEPSSLITLSSDPLEDVANNDFRPKQWDHALNQTGESQNFVIEGSASSFETKRDYGAVQRRRRMVRIGTS